MSSIAWCHVTTAPASAHVALLYRKCVLTMQLSQLCRHLCLAQLTGLITFDVICVVLNFASAR